MVNPYRRNSVSFAPLVLPDLRHGYVEIVRSVLRHGRERSARGFKAWDVADACFTILDTTRVLPLGVGRDPKVAIGYAEALLLCAGVESPSLLVSVSGTFRRFMDGGALAGSYGPLVRPQMEYVLSTLRGDRDSRQAVVQVHPGLQNVQGLRDVPCTINLGFELRGDELHMRATMRSNDAWLGLAYDAFQFCQLGWTVANLLDVPLASYTHHAYSLHLYERNADDFDNLYDASAIPLPAPEPTGFGLVAASCQYEVVRRRAEDVYNGTLRYPSQSEAMYVDTLAPFSRVVNAEQFAS